MSEFSIKELSQRHEELFKKHREKKGAPISPNKELEQDAIELIEVLDNKVEGLSSISSIARLVKYSDFWRHLYRYCKIQDVYLRIERIPNYSPVDPDPEGAYQYR